MDSIRSVLKTTEEIVTQARLNQIAKEHRSIGSILDDREIFPLEDPRKNGKFELDKKLNLRRSTKTEIELKEQIDTVKVELPEKGVAVDINNNDYEIERGIWKTLSSEKEYFAKMNHQHPELQELRESLKGKDKDMFKENVKKAIVNLAEKFREECRALKRDLDSNGVFHPEANAHRVHCLYRLKLYKNLHCYSIEYPILKAIYEEKLRVAREEKRKAELLARFEQSGHWPVSMHEKESSSGEKGLFASMSGYVGSNGDATGSTDPNGDKTSAAKRGSKASLGVRFTDDNRSLSTSSTNGKSTGPSNTKVNTVGKKKVPGGGSMSSNARSIPPGHKLKPITGSSELPTIEDDVDDSSNGSSKFMPTKSSAAGNTTGAFSTQPLNAVSTDRVFQRIKRGKLGGADPRGLLPEDAARLDKGEVSAVRKHRDKNDLLENQVSSWMLSSLQESQIAKTALGGAGAIVPVPIPTSLGSNKNSPAAPAVGSQLSPLVQSFAQSFNMSERNLVSNDPFSPKRLLNFDQFYQMFDEYRTLATTATAQSNAVNTTHTPLSLYHGFSNSSTINSPLRSTKTGSTADLKKKSGSAISDNGNDLGDVEDPVLAASASATALHADAMRPATLNIVKHLSDIDPQFAAYLKIAGYHKSNERTMAKLNGKMTNPKKARKLNLLGKDAVNLLTASSKSIRSSRKQSHVTTQGFVNFFQVTSLGDEEDGGADDGEEGRKVHQDHLAVAHSDDILTRLRKLEEDDLTHLSDEEHAQKKSWKDNNVPKGGVLESDGADSVDMHSLLSSQGSASTFTRAGSKSRHRQRAANGGSGSNTQQDIQAKLTTVWDSLMLSATSRLAFMRKYSQLSHCRYMCKAVDLWAETTVFLLSLTEMLAVEKKIKDGSYDVAAFTSKALHSSFKKRVPQLLSSSAESLIPISMQRTDYLKDGGIGEAVSQSTAQEAPLSAIAIVKVKFAIERVLSSAKGAEIVSSLAGLSEREQIAPSLRLIHMIIDELLPELSNSLLRAQQELDDNIPYKNKTCKEWMLELALRERDVK